MSITEALARLDPANDEHWTDDGLPRMDVMKELTGDDSITRHALTAAAPDFRREAAPAIGAVAAGEVEGEPEEEVDVLDLPRSQVLANYELCCRARAALGVKNQETLRAKAAAEAELRQINVKNDLLSRAIIAHERKNPSLRRTNPIRDYLDAQNRAREERAKRVQSFIDAGVTPEEVAARLRVKSPLDAAMAARRPKPGSVRPAVQPVKSAG